MKHFLFLGSLISFYDKNRKLIILTFFAVAMGILEATVVVYLRQIYYPHGFSFPLQMLSIKIVSIEIFREIATLVMLLTISLLAGKNWLRKICYFIYIFAIWDISYYAGLKLFLIWPQSLLSWDLLFLIPLPWISPVLAPIGCSLVMITISIILIPLDKRRKLVIRFHEKLLFLFSVAILFISFIWNYSAIIFENKLLSELFSLSKSNEFQMVISNYKPTDFGWELYLLGILLSLVSLFSIIHRVKKPPKIAD